MKLLKRFIADLAPPILLKYVQKLWRRLHGLGWHNFNGSWPALADVPVSAGNRDSDPWAHTIGAKWRENLSSATTPTCDDTGTLILPLFASQYSGPLTVLDFGGGAGIGLADILKFARVDLSHLTYILVETPAMCRAVRKEIEAYSGKVIEHMPATLPKPLIVNAASSIQYISDYKSALSQLAGLGPDFFIVSQTPMTDGATYARQVLNAPHRTIAAWVFNREDFIAEVRVLGYELIFHVDHNMQLTHKNAPGPSMMSSLVFGAATRCLNRNRSKSLST